MWLQRMISQSIAYKPVIGIWRTKEVLEDVERILT